MNKFPRGDTPADQGIRAVMIEDSQRAIPENMDLGQSLLIIEFQNGRYWPVSIVNSIGEAREIATGHARAHRGGGGSYYVWARDSDGDYNPVAEIVPQ